MLLTILGRFDEASREADRCLAIDPDNTLLLAYRWLIAMESGDSAIASTSINSAFDNLDLPQQFRDDMADLGEALAQRNREAALATLRRQVNAPGVLPYNRTGFVYLAARLGDDDFECF